MTQSAVAEQYFRGVYCGNPAVVAELAAEDIVISYPIFAKLFNKPTLRGKEAAWKFAEDFSNNWLDAELTVHEVVAVPNKVVLVWSYSARQIGSQIEGVEPTNQVHSWGGITLFCFNQEGKIEAEIGEESEPGPMARLTM